jgi:hypothetical protein
MAATIGAWERKAKLCLVDASLDKDIFTSILENLLDENKLNDEVSKITSPQIELARQNLSASANDKFICMFVWGFDKQHYLPFCSGLFTNDDTEVIQQIVTQFIEISVQCCSDGFEIVTFNEENKLLALAVQALSENRMMQFNLQNSEGNE